MRSMVEGARRGCIPRESGAVTGLNPVTSVALRALAGGFACPAGTGG